MVEVHALNVFRGLSLVCQSDRWVARESRRCLLGLKRPAAFPPTRRSPARRLVITAPSARSRQPTAELATPACRDTDTRPRVRCFRSPAFPTHTRVDDASAVPPRAPRAGRGRRVAAPARRRRGARALRRDRPVGALRFVCVCVCWSARSPGAPRGVRPGPLPLPQTQNPALTRAPSPLFCCSPPHLHRQPQAARLRRRLRPGPVQPRPRLHPRRGPAVHAALCRQDGRRQVWRRRDERPGAQGARDHRPRAALDGRDPPRARARRGARDQRVAGEAGDRGRVQERPARDRR